MWIIICSPVSGKQRGRGIVEQELIPALIKRGLLYKLELTTHRYHAVSLGESSANSKECEGIIAVGGDGTINEVLQGMLKAKRNLPLAVFSQGTMNFFNVCAGLPFVASDLADVIVSGTTRPASLMKINDDAISFEAVHLGHMPYGVCKGAGDWRFSFGPMFGIVLNLVWRNALPKKNLQKGTLRVWPANGDSAYVIKDEFFWIICTTRSPYNGVVGTTDMWVSWMTMKSFPGFDRMMKFFEPQMEHFQGTSRCFGCHVKAVKMEFTMDDAFNNVALVADGDPMPCGNTATITNMPSSWRVVGSEEPPEAVDTKRIMVGGAPTYTAKPLTIAAQRWLTMYPPPRNIYFPQPAVEQVKKDDIPAYGLAKKNVFIALFLAITFVMYRRRAA